MIESPETPTDRDVAYYTCSCCGTLFNLYDPQQNAEYDEPWHRSEAHDADFGMCTRCGGYAPSVTPPEEPAGAPADAQREAAAPRSPEERRLRKKMGWAWCAFMDTRIEGLGGANSPLGPENRAKFRGLSFAKQTLIIQGLVQKGFLT